MNETTEILTFFGFRKSKPTTLWEIAEKGLIKSTLKRLIERTQLPPDVVLRYLNVSSKELKKDNVKARFGISVSDRILDLTRLYLHGIMALEAVENFNFWLSEPLLVLNAQKPIDLLYSSHGLKTIDDILLRIEYNISV